MIRVLVVDDSAVVRKVLTKELSKYGDIEVVGSAIDPYSARDKIVELKPDVVTLDIEMPKMDGLSFLEKLMRYYPIPVVIVSSLIANDEELSRRAKELGAVEIIPKPSMYSAPEISRLVEAVRKAARTKVEKREAPPVQGRKIEKVQLQTTHKVIAIGASTGGTKALELILSELPPSIPGIVVVQHMPENFTKSFADRLNSICQIEVREAKDGDGVVPGVARRLPSHLKVPHMGWNQVKQKIRHPLFEGIPDEANFYFVHSYYPDLEGSVVAGTTQYGLRFCSVLVRGNLVATQFHPEKSGELGLRMYANFLKFAGGFEPC